MGAGLRGGRSATIRTVYATLGAVFGGIESFRSNDGDLMFVATMEPLVFDVPRLRERLAQEPYRRALACAWKAWDLEGFIGCYIGNSRGSRARCVCAAARRS